MRQNDQIDESLGPIDLVRAVEYVRMSTEHQQYSTENQAAKIREYAAQRGIEVLRTYTDAGKSGLNMEGRKSLQQLLKDVESGSADFTLILVYDVSRWGRFQDADESAYYEYRCRRAGIQVVYCAEQFENDGSPVSTIVKGVKRAMAGEYSRELSAKVFAGQCRLIEMGYRQGGAAGYGLRRVLLDQNGSVKLELANGEHKCLVTDRVILMPGPVEEIRIVNLMYHWLIDEGISETAIVSRLNGMGIRSNLDREWSRGAVHDVLTNEKYIGNNVFNRSSFKLQKVRVENPAEMWIKKEAAFEPIVPAEVFYTAQAIIKARTDRITDEELLERLRELYRQHGHISKLIINESDNIPSTAVYIGRFGSLVRAYKMVGFTPEHDYRYIEINKYLRRLHPEIVDKTESQIANLGGVVLRDPTTDILMINGEFNISIVLARCKTAVNGSRHWKVRFDTSLLPDLTVVVRLDQTNQSVLDYYLLPRLDFGELRLNLADQNSIEFECYRFDTLDYLYGMAKRTQLRRAA